MCAIDTGYKIIPRSYDIGHTSQGFVNAIRRDKIKEVNELLKKEYFKLASRVFYMELDSD